MDNTKGGIKNVRDNTIDAYSSIQNLYLRI